MTDAAQRYTHACYMEKARGKGNLQRVRLAHT